MRPTLLLLAAVLMTVPACSAPTPQDNVQEYDVDAGNVTLFARRVGGEHGDSFPVVLLHGGPGWSSEYLRPMQDALATTSRSVVIFDQRGCGRSTPPANSPNNYQLSLYAGDLEAVRLALEADALHLVAHDFGALVATTYAATFSSASSIAMFGAAPPTDLEFDAAKIRLASHINDLQTSGEIPTSIPPTEGQDCSPPLHATVPAYYSDPDYSGDGLLSSLQCANAVKENTNGAIGGYSVAADLGSFAQPTLLLYGADDAFGTEMGQQTADAMSEPLNQVSNCGHFWQECASDVAAQLDAFLP